MLTSVCMMSACHHHLGSGTGRWGSTIISMTSSTSSASDRWDLHGGVTDMWPRSTVNRSQSLTGGPGQWSTLTGQWPIQAGPRLGWLGLDTGWALARHVAHAGAATSSYWATNGPWSMDAGGARFMVNLPALVHRPQSRSMKDLVHLLLPRVRFTYTTW